MRSPLHYLKITGTMIDLSQLAEVSDAYQHRVYGGDGAASRDDYVAFSYRYAACEKPIEFVRKFHRGPVRNSDLTLRDPQDILLTVREEAYEIIDDSKAWSRSTIIVYDEETGKIPVAVPYLQQEVDLLRKYWAEWKAIEPEVYAHIRNHMGA